MNLSRRVFLLLGVMAMAASCVGCSGHDDSPQASELAGPVLVAIDSILLTEADTLYIGYPFGLLIDPYDGSIYVSDSFSKRTYRFARTGRLLRTYGRPGKGPGEFNSHAQFAVLDEATLAAPGMDPAAIHIFDRQSGEHLWSSPIPALLLGTGQPAHSTDAVWFPALSIAGESTMLVWNTREARADLLGTLPDEYRRSREQPGVFHIMRGGGGVALGENGVLRGWAGLRDLEHYSVEGELLGRVTLPVARRRGVPADVQQTIDLGRRGPLKTFAAMEEYHSWLRQLSRLPSGGYGFTHHDLQVHEENGPMGEPVVSATVYAGILAADLSQACVDAVVPAKGDVQPIEAFVGDTLFVLDRRLNGAALQTWVLMYLLDDSTCDWVPVLRN